MKIISSKKPRSILYWHDLSRKEKAEFDYIADEELDSAQFFRYRG